jgi:hypothetical protein
MLVRVRRIIGGSPGGKGGIDSAAQDVMSDEQNPLIQVDLAEHRVRMLDAAKGEAICFGDRRAQHLARLVEQLLHHRRRRHHRRRDL